MCNGTGVTISFMGMALDESLVLQRKMRASIIPLLFWFIGTDSERFGVVAFDERGRVTTDKDCGCEDTISFD